MDCGDAGWDAMMQFYFFFIPYPGFLKIVELKVYTTIPYQNEL